MKSIIKILLAIVILVNFALLFVIYKTDNKEIDRIRTVNLERVFEDFEMTKELDKKYESSTLNSTKAIDSLTFKIQRLQEVLRGNMFDPERTSELNILAFKKDKLMEEVAKIKSEFEGQIWNRLNIMIDNYGDSKDHILIVGSDNEREILYAKNTIDITDELILFVNQKYRGG